MSIFNVESDLKLVALSFFLTNSKKRRRKFVFPSEKMNNGIILYFFQNSMTLGNKCIIRTRNFFLLICLNCDLICNRNKIIINI